MSWRAHCVLIFNRWLPHWLAFCFLHLVALAEDNTATQRQLIESRLAEVLAMAPPEFTVLAQAPFVVAGDEEPEVVRQRAKQTVKFAVDRLKQGFFASDPDEVIAIWLFKDKASYEAGVLALFKEAPDSPFGFYSARHRALLMNIATGGGTLVHEIVHPFIEANFPKCPVWFNEGLASLFEQSAERKGHIVGLPNWRLPGLQKLIRNGELPSFEHLFGLSPTEFYTAKDGYNSHYGQARYLCYYLQEHGLLVKFYREFSANHETDPTGRQTLLRVLGEDDLAKFQERWENYVLGLRYPERRKKADN